MTSDEASNLPVNGAGVRVNYCDAFNTAPQPMMGKTKSNRNHSSGSNFLLDTFSLSTGSNAFIWLLISLAVISIVNLISALWVMKVLQLNSSGMGKGNLNFVANGIVIQRDANVLGQLISHSIWSEDKEAPLKITSEARSFAKDASASHSVSSFAVSGCKDRNFLSIESDKVEVTSPHFVVKQSHGGSEEVAFEVKNDHLSTSLLDRVISPVGGLNVQSTVQTNCIHGSTHHDINLESRRKSVYIDSPNEVNIESRAGDLKVSAYGAISVNSKEHLSLDSRNVHFTGLTESNLMATDEAAELASPSLQVCACESGLLYTVAGDGVCSLPSNSPLCNEETTGEM